MKIIAFTGMPGSGKSVATEHAKGKGYTVLRLGDLTDEEIKKRSLVLNEDSERMVRESLREQFGMDVYAKSVAEKVDKLQASVVVLDGVRSFEEYEYLKGKYGNDFVVVSVLGSPKTRYSRLMDRDYRGLSEVECVERDMSEMKELNLTLTIVMADCFIVNESSKEALEKSLESLFSEIEEKS